jgi:hypothetical protein
VNGELRLTDLETAREAGFIEQVKAALGLPADAQLQLQNIVHSAQGGAVVEYAVTLPIKIVGAEFGAADGVTVDERVNALLNFDANGVRLSSRISPLDAQHLHLVKDNVRKLAASDRIYLAAPGEAIDADALRAERKPWYVETDAQGHKRLKRAFIA